MTKHLAATGVWLVIFAGLAPAGEIKIEPRKPVFIPPDDSQQWDDWRRQLIRWRQQTGTKLGYNDALYRRDDLVWARKNFNCAFVMLWDETWWDWRQGRFTPEKFLDDGRRRFGGFDSVVLWHAYPRIGFDRRNQFDFYRDMPGGLDGLRQLSQKLHQRGVKVFIDYNPWDRGTRREDKDDLHALADLVGAIEADGIFLDTLHGGSGQFRQLLDAVRPGVVLESELALAVESVHDHHLSWAQWFIKPGYRGPVGVVRNKWFERRHMLHFINRWQRDHTAELHAAWLNGVGMLVWENVFGQLRIWSPRDQSILRAVAPIQRQFSDLFAGEGWTPLVATQRSGVLASLWEHNGLRLWTLVNLSDDPVDGELLRVDRREGDRCFDLVAGREIDAAHAQGKLLLAGRIPGRGIAALLAADPAGLPEDFQAFLKGQAQRAADSDFSAATTTPPEKRFAVAKTKLYKSADLPPEMVAVPAASFEMRVTFSSREVGQYQTPLQRSVDLTPFAIDLTPVTNARFARFLSESRYRPTHPKNFLKHWVDGRPPLGKEDHPVVYVGLEDARAYAAWAGKRLPTEEEWQYAAGGPKGQEYPWGSRLDPALCNGNQQGTTPVKAFPTGRSPLGLYDMCGNTWEWTESERGDGRSRFCVIKGGCYFKARGSRWYPDGGPQPTRQAAKFLLMWPGLDRCATISFRCAVDMH